MNIEVPILTKTGKNIEQDIKVLSSTDIVNLKQVQAIRNAVKEHLLFIGLDRGNNVRNISVLGIGSNCEVLVDSKDIIRTALLSCSERVILVHNHPSNNLEPSNPDIHITNITNNLLKTFHIELLDHIIVTEKEHISMEKIKKFNKNYTNDEINKVEKQFLYEENLKLKQEIEKLQYNKDLQEINKLAVIYSLLDEVQIEAAKGYCEYNGKFDMDIQELLNVCMQSGLISYYQYNFEGSEYCSMFSKEEKYGYTLAEENGIHKLLVDNGIEYCFDFEKYGRDACINNNITLLENGYLDLSDTLNLQAFSKEEIQEKVDEYFIQEECEIKVKPILNKMDKLRNEFKKITSNDQKLTEYFKEDKRYTNIRVAGVILAGMAVRNLQRENGNLEGELEYSPFSKEQEKMIDDYTELEKMVEYIEQEVESEYAKEEITNDI